MNEQNKFLTEAMGERWYGQSYPKDGRPENYKNWASARYEHMFNDFSTWEGFGKLWEWSLKQEWWPKFKNYLVHRGLTVADFVQPECFAKTVYEFLKDRK